MMISHNTSFKTYRRAGLCLYQKSQPFEVTEEQLKILQNDPRVFMHEVKTVKETGRDIKQGN